MKEIKLRDDLQLICSSGTAFKLTGPSFDMKWMGVTASDNRIVAIDPPGGPYIEEGDVIEDMVVVAFDLNNGVAVHMLPVNEPDIGSKSDEIRKDIVMFTSANRDVEDKAEDVRERIVVGMIGKAGSGKDTVGDYLRDEYGFTGLALADTLKRGVQEMFVIPDDIMYDREKREQPLHDMPDWTVRKLLQFVGTELVRTHIDDMAWTKSLIKRYPEIGDIVVTDVRFPNEIAAIRELSGCSVFFIRVSRPGHIGTDIGIKNHASEIHDLEGDFDIENNGTIDDLYGKVDEIIKQLRDM